MERRTATIPLWTAIAMVVTMLVSGAGVLYAATSAASRAQIKAIENDISEDKALSKENEKRITDVEKLLARVIANEENLTKIVDRLVR